MANDIVVSISRVRDIRNGFFKIIPPTIESADEWATMFSTAHIQAMTEVVRHKDMQKILAESDGHDNVLERLDADYFDQMVAKYLVQQLRESSWMEKSTNPELIRALRADSSPPVLIKATTTTTTTQEDTTAPPAVAPETTTDLLPSTSRLLTTLTTTYTTNISLLAADLTETLNSLHLANAQMLTLQADLDHYRANPVKRLRPRSTNERDQVIDKLTKECVTKETEMADLRAKISDVQDMHRTVSEGFDKYREEATAYFGKELEKRVGLEGQVGELEGRNGRLRGLLREGVDVCVRGDSELERGIWGEKARRVLKREEEMEREAREQALAREGEGEGEGVKVEEDEDEGEIVDVKMEMSDPGSYGW